jgi:plastocyanin
MAFVGAIVVLRQVRRPTGALRSGTRAEKHVVKIGAIAVGALVVVSGVLTYTRNADIDAPPGALVVETSGDEFNPSDLTLEPGRNQVLVVNRDSYAHTFGSDVLGIDQYVGPRADRLITVEVPDEPGRYELYCSVTGHEDMTGTVEIKD